MSKPAASSFSRPRFALLVALGVYPVVTALLYLVFPLTNGWALWQRTLVLVPVIVIVMIWAIIPLIHRRFGAFLHRSGRGLPG
ncbi:hypothetical protein [Breoghania sp. L-A4]|uniref:hypothetical protein n=1 Tax=Breoghania sp. L-A4 TaxID=2304600 RepID=UPI000E358A7D|nr:hypothetical protein [Breoghania sp. L-A4]AXS42039.1 hypothetical protein D1F64_21100 [Breoghania sp. L-A4]